MSHFVVTGSRGHIRWTLLFVLATVTGATAQTLLLPQQPDMLQVEFETALQEFEQAQRIQASKPDQARKLFQSAASRFAAIAQSGIVNGRLEYNLGNAYLQAGDVGRGILHYRRAERILPRDPLLADNLVTARKRCLTPIAQTRRSAVMRSLLFWHFETSWMERLHAALGAYLGIWTVLTVRNFISRRSVTILATGLALVTVILGASLGSEQWLERNVPEGVVTSMDVVVYRGPGTGYQRQFEQPLQPGVEFTIRERRANWWHLTLPDGQSGWIDEQTAELIEGSPGSTLPFR
ncbi:MAG: SH3 domain-containing protein [Planctomycetota bacterium]